jgi:serine O-acetyltransferase
MTDPLPPLGALIASDLRAKADWLYGSNRGRNLLKAAVTDGTFAMFMYRLMQFCHKRRLAPVAMVFNKLINWFGGCVIGRGADFGPAFVLVHSLGVVINTSVKGGRHVVVEHQVTIGAEREKSPVLGDEVFIGAGAKVLGGITLGNDVRVGANAVVLNDVPDGATVAGVPAKIVAMRREETG